MSHRNGVGVLLLALVLVGAAVMTTGCFGKGGGGSSAPAVSNIQAGNIVARSVATAKGADGAVTVTWKTQAPSMGNHVLAGTLFFEGRPLYDQVVKETAAAPATDHTAVVPAAAGELGIAVTDGLSGLDDNGGLGYVVK